MNLNKKETSKIIIIKSFPLLFLEQISEFRISEFSQYFYINIISELLIVNILIILI